LLFPWPANYERTMLTTQLIPRVSIEATIALKTTGLLLLLVPFLAIAAASAAAESPAGRSALGPFQASRPLTTATLVALKLQAVTWSTLITWAVALPMLGLWLLPAARFEALWEFRGAWLQDYSTFEVVALVLLVLAIFILQTWNLQVNGLFLGFTGRRRLITGGGLGCMFCFMVLVAVLLVPASRAVFWLLLPALAGTAVLLKLGAAGWSADAVVRRGLVSAESVAAVLGIWLVAAVGLSALLVWLVPAGLVSAYLLICAAILEIPLARLLAAPLVLAWDRHR
jgi:hypothetical protein